MASGFPTDFKEVVRSRTNLVELIGESVRLAPARGGADFVGLCPFHQDHNPSFHVYPDRQSWRCWVCNEGGDCFSYVEKIEGISFFDALKSLAERANLELPNIGRSSEQFQQRKSEREQMYAALKWAEDKMHDCLLHSKDAVEVRNYLSERGFSIETITRFRLGYHPDSWDWLLKQATGRFELPVLLSARLAAEKKSGIGHNDSHIFIDRVIFPIHDARGRTISFGGRVLPGGDGPKYYNGNDSDLFHKSEVLYGFHHAREAIRRSRTAFVVEGYTDCIAAQMAGIENIVGVLGTALTEQHVSSLKLISDQVILIYDGDEAGQLNADRVVGKFLSQDVDLKILTLPDGLDPAEYLAAHGVDAFQTLVESALEAWEFKYQKLLEKHGTHTEGSRQSVLSEMLELMGQAPKLAGTLREDSLLGRLSQRLLIPEKKIREQLTKVRSKQAGSSLAYGTGNISESGDSNSEFERLVAGHLDKHEKTEAGLLEIILTSPEWIGLISNRLSPEELRNPYFRAFYQNCCDLHESGRVPSREGILAHTEDSDLKRLAVVLEDWSQHKGIAEKLAETDVESNVPSFLLQQLEILLWRGEVTKHERTKGEIAGYTSLEGSLSDKDKELLLKIKNFNQKRTNQKSTI
ncbi:MAG TPA: DNA primase [Planctomycetaceae bacterium]|nr:DNA primase [Planctomycetaceae bacterium]